MVNPIGLNAAKPNRLTKRQMNKLRKLINDRISAECSLAIILEVGPGHMEDDAKKHAWEAATALAKYLDNLLEK